MNIWKDIKKLPFYHIENLVTNVYVYAQEDESPQTFVKACVRQRVFILNFSWYIILFPIVSWYLKNRHQLKFGYKIEVLLYRERKS